MQHFCHMHNQQVDVLLATVISQDPYIKRLWLMCGCTYTIEKFSADNTLTCPEHGRQVVSASVDNPCGKSAEFVLACGCPGVLHLIAAPDGAV